MGRGKLAKKQTTREITQRSNILLEQILGIHKMVSGICKSENFIIFFQKKKKSATFHDRTPPEFFPHPPIPNLED